MQYLQGEQVFTDDRCKGWVQWSFCNSGLSEILTVCDVDLLMNNNINIMAMLLICVGHQNFKFVLTYMCKLLQN